MKANQKGNIFIVVLIGAAAASGNGTFTAGATMTKTTAKPSRGSRRTAFY